MRQSWSGVKVCMHGCEKVCQALSQASCLGGVYALPDRMVLPTHGNEHLPQILRITCVRDPCFHAVHKGVAAQVWVRKGNQAVAQIPQGRHGKGRPQPSRRATGVKGRDKMHSVAALGGKGRAQPFESSTAAEENGRMFRICKVGLVVSQVGSPWAIP